MIAISTREGNQHVVTGHRQTTSRTSLGDLATDLTTELRIRRITHTQLHTGAEDVLHLDTEVHLAQCRSNEVNTERQRAFGHQTDTVFCVREIASQCSPAVDDKEDIAIAIVKASLSTASAIGRHRVDTVRTEVGSSVLNNAFNFGHHTVQDVLILSRGNTRNVSGTLESGKSTREIDNEELNFLRSMGQRQSHDNRAQCRGLTGKRAAQDRHVTAGTGKVVFQNLAPLFVRKVDDAHGDMQRSLRTPFVRNEAEFGIHSQVGHERIHGVGDIQRRQPHLVGRHTLTLHAGDRDINLGHALPALITGRNQTAFGNCLFLGSVVQHFPQREGKQSDLRGLGTRTGQNAARRWWCGNVGGAETDQLVSTRLEEARTRVGRKVVGIRHAQDFSRFRGGEGLQTNAVGQVRIQALELSRLQALRGQKNMDRQGSAQTTNCHE